MQLNEALLLPEKNQGRTGKKTCKSVEQEENHEKGPRWSGPRIQMGYIIIVVFFYEDQTPLGVPRAGLVLRAFIQFWRN